MGNSIHPVTQYALDVVYGEYGRKYCGEYEVLACKRHLNDLEKAKDPNYPYVFDETRADRIVRFFNRLNRVDVPDTLIQLEPWQVFDKGCIFGWVDRKTGKRRFSRAYQRIARGHAKTTDAGGVGIYFMTSDAMYPPGEPEKATYEMEPEVEICAVDSGQGKIAWSDLTNLANASKLIMAKLDVKKTYIRHKTRGGRVVILSKDSRNKDGMRPSLLIVEEWHAHQTSEVHDTAANGLGKKRQCLEYIITTAGTDAENKPCYRDDLYYKQILRGEFENEDTFVMIREIDDNDDPHDRSCWVKANPFFRGELSDYAQNLYQQVVSEHEAAYGANDLDKIRAFLIKRMNRWQADSENKYFSGCMERLKANAMPPDEFAKLTRGTRGHYGYDLGKCVDLTGVAYVTFLDDGRLAVKVHGFMPQNRAIEHAHSDRVPYLEWAKAGWVTLTPGDVTINSYVENWVYEAIDDKEWECLEVDYDGHNATDLAIRMRETFNAEEKVVEIPQTCAMLNQATKRFREMVLEGKVVCENDPLLFWCLSNAIEIQNNFGDIKLSKKHKNDSQRIDPVAAMINALARLLIRIDNEPQDINKIIRERGFAMR